MPNLCYCGRHITNSKCSIDTCNEFHISLTEMSKIIAVENIQLNISQFTWTSRCLGCVWFLVEDVTAGKAKTEHSKPGFMAVSLPFRSAFGS